MNFIWGMIAGIVVGVIGCGIYFKFIKKPGLETKRDLMEENRQKYTENMAKIESFLAGKDKITNTDVEELLGVSDATATRYLDDLEAAGKITQIGTGSDTYYQINHNS